MSAGARTGATRSRSASRRASSPGPAWSGSFATRSARAAGRRGVLTSATKSNASRFGYVLWDEIVEEVAADFPDVRVERVLVDALAARMVRDPGSLDVVVASNLFADILTDIAAAIQGGMGMAASPISRPDPTRRASSSPCTDPRPTSRGRESRIPLVRSGARR